MYKSRNSLRYIHINDRQEQRHNAILKFRVLNNLKCLSVSQWSMIETWQTLCAILKVKSVT